MMHNWSKFCLTASLAFGIALSTSYTNADVKELQEKLGGDHGLKNSMGTLKEKLRAFSEKLGKLRTGLDEINNPKAKDLTPQIKENTKTLEDLEKKVDSLIPEFSKALDILKTIKESDELTKILTKGNQYLDQLTGVIPKIKAKITSLNENLKTLTEEKNLAPVEAEIVKLVTNFSPLKDAYDEQIAKVKTFIDSNKPEEPTGPSDKELALETIKKNITIAKALSATIQKNTDTTLRAKYPAFGHKGSKVFNDIIKTNWVPTLITKIKLVETKTKALDAIQAKIENLESLDKAYAELNKAIDSFTKTQTLCSSQYSTVKGTDSLKNIKKIADYPA